MQADHHDATFDMDEASHRLNEIYERMQEVRHALSSIAAWWFVCMWRCHSDTAAAMSQPYSELLGLHFATTNHVVHN
jgi:hypothetical protein